MACSRTAALPAAPTPLAATTRSRRPAAEARACAPGPPLRRSPKRANRSPHRMRRKCRRPGPSAVDRALPSSSPAPAAACGHARRRRTAADTEASFSRQRSKPERQECAACRARTASQNRASASACSASDRPCSRAYNRRQSGPAGNGAHAKIGSTPPTGGAGIVPCTSSRIAMHHT